MLSRLCQWCTHDTLCGVKTSPFSLPTILSGTVAVPGTWYLGLLGGAMSRAHLPSAEPPSPPASLPWYFKMLSWGDGGRVGVVAQVQLGEPGISVDAFVSWLLLPHLL